MTRPFAETGATAPNSGGPRDRQEPTVGGASPVVLAPEASRLAELVVPSMAFGRERRAVDHLQPMKSGHDASLTEITLGGPKGHSIRKAGSSHLTPPSAPGA